MGEKKEEIKFFILKMRLMDYMDTKNKFTTKESNNLIHTIS